MKAASPHESSSSSTPTLARHADADAAAIARTQRHTSHSSLLESPISPRHESGPEETLLSAIRSSTSSLLHHDVPFEATLVGGISSPLDEHCSSGSLSPWSQSSTTATGSFASSCINLMNTLLGAGMLSMPKAYSTIGFGPGALLVFLMGFSSALGLHLLSYSAAFERHRDASFFSLAQITFPKATLLFDTAIAIKCFGVATSYLIIVGDLMPQVIQGIYRLHEITLTDSILISPLFWISCSMLICIPLTLLKKLDSLKYTSLVALFAVVYLFSLTIYFFSTTKIELPVEEQAVWIRPLSWAAVEHFAVFVFAFTCHQNIFAIFNEKRDNSINSMNRVIGLSVFLSAVIYWTMGHLGYVLFGSHVADNILTAFPQTVAVLIARASYVFLTVFSYPLQSHPCRSSLEKMIQSCSGHASKQQKRWIWWWLSILILISTFSISMTGVDLSLMLALVGATGSVTISYLLPAAFYIQLRRLSLPGSFDTSRVRYVLAWMLLLLGLLVMITCCTALLYRLSSGQHSVSH